MVLAHCIFTFSIIIIWHGWKMHFHKKQWMTKYTRNFQNQFVFVWTNNVWSNNANWNISIKLLGDIWNMLGIWSKHEHDQQQIKINCKEQTWTHNRRWNNANGNEMLQQQRWWIFLQMKCYYANTLLQCLWAHGKMVSLKVMDFLEKWKGMPKEEHSKIQVVG